MPSQSQMLMDIEHRVNVLQPKDRKGRTKKTIQAVLLVLLGALSLIILLQVGKFTDDGTPQERLQQIYRNADKGYIWLAALLVGAILVFESLKMAYIVKLTIKKFRPFLSFKVTVIGKYYDELTPLASGGQPFQIYYLSKNDVPIGAATSIPLIRYFIQIFVWIFCSLGLFVFNGNALAGTGTVTIAIAAYFGLALNSLIPLTLIAFSIMPRFSERVVKFILRAGVRLRLVKNYDEMLEKAYKLVDEFKTSMRYVASRPIHVAALVLICVADYVLMLTVPYCLYLAFGGTPSASAWADIMTLYSFAYYSVSFIPIPGTSGFAESAFYFAFSNITLSSGALFWIVLIWRLLTFYSYIILGLLTVFYDFVKNSYKARFVERKRLLTVRETLIANLSSPDPGERMANLRVIKSLEYEDRKLAPKPRANDIKLRLKSSYSGGNQPPALLAYKCYASGCRVAALVDTDTLAGAREFFDACTILGMAAVIGAEVSVKPPKSLKQGGKINNPFQSDLLTMSIMGIPPYSFDRVEEALSVIRDRRNVRLKNMTEQLSLAFAEAEVSLDFDRDVKPLSAFAEGGAVTEMHISEALALSLAEQVGRGPELISFLSEYLGIGLSLRMEKKLLSVTSPEYIRDLSTALLGKVREFYLPAGDECLTLGELKKLAEGSGSAIVYPYLGDIEQIVFGEIRLEKYEDSILECLISELSAVGLAGISYSPQRNAESQQQRVQQLCRDFGLLELCEGAIYTRKLSVAEPELDPSAYSRLIDSVYALLGSSRAEDVADTMFSESTQKRIPKFDDLLALYSARGRNIVAARAPVPAKTQAAEEGHTIAESAAGAVK